ncbi:uncharacterized protein LOC131882392 [Tigriopus californicus]|uniref:uncharacterized protein LOC131882392 n=1 Tax=Tigriopus californicus TaxID=6832 RepID=UPI0027DA89C6|nr:uncharacterized protein LOC131882392 [Tigriopus californicus]
MADHTLDELNEHGLTGENSTNLNGAFTVKKIEDLLPIPQGLPNPKFPSKTECSSTPSALEVELQMLEPIWFEAVCRENKGATVEQIQILVDIKLQQVRQLIPARWMAEKTFKSHCQMLEQIHDSLAQVLTTLQSNEIVYSSARIEEYQAQRAIQDWSTSRQPDFEASYQEASRAWYKPGNDPLTTPFTCIRDKFGSLIARYEYERSIRPALGGGDVGSGGSPNNSEPTPSCPTSCPVTMKQFNVSTRIDRFEGDLKDPNVMAIFTRWKSQWEALVEEMKTLPGFDTVLLFDKLQQVLSPLALKSVFHHPPASPHSYEAAMKDLCNKFEDPMAVVTLFMIRGLTRRSSSLKQLQYVKESFNWLQNVKSTFQLENVDVFSFALNSTFVKALSRDMIAKWEQYKIQVKRDYRLKCEAAKNSGDPLPEWKCGMVENYDQFKAWLRLQSAQLKQSTSRKRPSSPSMTETQPPMKKRLNESSCFICDPVSPSHRVSACRRALSMPLKVWKKVCQNRSFCFKCADFL